MFKGKYFIVTFLNIAFRHAAISCLNHCGLENTNCRKFKPQGLICFLFCATGIISHILKNNDQDFNFIFGLTMRIERRLQSYCITSELALFVIAPPLMCLPNVGNGGQNSIEKSRLKSKARPKFFPSPKLLILIVKSSLAYTSLLGSKFSCPDYPRVHLCPRDMVT